MPSVAPAPTHVSLNAVAKRPAPADFPPSPALPRTKFRNSWPLYPTPSDQTEISRTHPSFHKGPSDDGQHVTANQTMTKVSNQSLTKTTTTTTTASSSFDGTATTRTLTTTTTSTTTTLQTTSSRSTKRATGLNHELEVPLLRGFDIGLVGPPKYTRVTSRASDDGAIDHDRRYGYDANDWHKDDTKHSSSTAADVKQVARAAERNRFTSGHSSAESLSPATPSWAHPATLLIAAMSLHKPHKLTFGGRIRSLPICCDSMVQKYSSTGFDIEYSRVMNTIVHLSCGDLPYLNDAEFLNLLSVTHGLIRGLCPRASSISGDPQLVGWKIASRLLHAQGIIRQVPVCGIIFFSIMAACGVKLPDRDLLLQEMTAVAAGYGILPATLPSAEDSKVRLYIKIGSYLCVKYYETRWMRSIYDDCTKAFNSFGPSTELYEHAGQFMNSTRTTWYHIVPARISIPIVPIRPPVELACRSL